MTKDEEIRIINEKLDFYVMEASDEEFDTEEVRKLVKQLDGLGACPCYTTVTRTPKRQLWVRFPQGTLISCNNDCENSLLHFLFYGDCEHHKNI